MNRNCESGRWQGADVCRVPCTLMRGGTSRIVVLDSRALPLDPVMRDRVIVSILFGLTPSSAAQQLGVDGLGGPCPQMAKVALVGPAMSPCAHLDYTYCQVHPDNLEVDYEGNCGNTTAAVALYAVEEGYVPSGETVVINQTNTECLLRAQVHLPGDDGLRPAFSRAEIEVDYSPTCAALTGRLFPTDQIISCVYVSGVEVPVTVIDAGNLVAFFKCDSADHLAEACENVDFFESIRREVAALLKRDSETSSLPFVAGVSLSRTREHDLACEPKTDVSGMTGGMLEAMVQPYFEGRLLEACPVTVAVATALASVIPGTVIEGAPWGAQPRHGHSRLSCVERRVRVAGLKNTLDVRVKLRIPSNQGAMTAAGADCATASNIELVSLRTSARRLFDGHSYLEL
jgi:2-methylaconitate cis-trans-isomerase PrpF